MGDAIPVSVEFSRSRRTTCVGTLTAAATASRWHRVDGVTAVWHRLDAIDATTAAWHRVTASPRPQQVQVHSRHGAADPWIASYPSKGMIARHLLQWTRPQKLTLLHKGQRQSFSGSLVEWEGCDRFCGSKGPRPPPLPSHSGFFSSTLGCGIPSLIVGQTSLGIVGWWTYDT